MQILPRMSQTQNPSGCFQSIAILILSTISCNIKHHLDASAEVLLEPEELGTPRPADDQDGTFAHDARRRLPKPASLRRNVLQGLQVRRLRVLLPRLTSR